MPRSGDGIYLQGKTWWLQFRHCGQRYCVKIGANINRTVASQIAQVERAKILKGEAGIGKKDLSFKDAREKFEAWLEVNRKPNTVKSHKQALKQLAEKFDSKRLGQITTADLERYKVSKVTGERGKVAANQELSVLSSMMNRCRKLGVFGGENPVKGVERFKQSKGRERFLEWEEEARLLAAAEEPLRTIILCGVDAGFRLAAEALTLRWSGVDFRLGLLTVEAAYSKNGETGSVPMTDRLREALLKHRFRSGKRDPHDHVFESWPFKRMRKAFRKACAAAGLGADVTPHTCRHTFASRLVMQGENIVTVKELMRHKTIEMTMRYAHLSPTHKREAIRRLTPPPSLLRATGDNANAMPVPALSEGGK
jgi:integrase